MKRPLLATTAGLLATLAAASFVLPSSIERRMNRVRASKPAPPSERARRLHARLLVADLDGVVGIGYWRTAVCGDDAGAVARAIRHAVRRPGIDHVGLGSDFDGTVTTPFDASGVVGVRPSSLKASPKTTPRRSWAATSSGSSRNICPETGGQAAVARSRVP